MTTPKNDGGSAFPCDGHIFAGMSLRDWFAGMALQAMAVNGTYSRPDTARAAYDYADAMLAEREKGQQ